MAMAHAAASQSTLTTIGQLGLGAVVAAVLTALVAAIAASRRERDVARRAWLSDALSSFYSPVTTRLELFFRWNQALAQERAQRDPDAPIHHESVEAKTERKLVEANVKLLRELGAIVEGNLHYVDSPDLRDAAIAFLTARNIDEWRRHAAGADEALARGDVTVAFPSGPDQRSAFHQMVTKDFKDKAAEFQSLSRRERRWWWWWFQRRPGKKVKGEPR